MPAFSTYIPMDRRQALAGGDSLPDRTQGGVLLVDISGFTPLTTALAQELGPRRGIEELTRQLNAVYSALIAEVHRYRGSVIDFSGDAATCWFDDVLRPEGVASDGGLRALACGLAMQQVMRSNQFSQVSTPAGLEFPLSIHVALAGGPARRFLLGDPSLGRLEALAGRTLDVMAAGERLAGAGEVLVDEQLALRLGERLEIAGWRSDPDTGLRYAVATALTEAAPLTPWPAFSPQTQVQLEMQARPWLLAPVYLRLSCSEDEFLAEFRLAAALFVRFGGIDFDRDDLAGGKLDAYVRWVQSVLASLGGYLIQLTIGDKGAYFYAAFGAPIAHDDNAARAIAAALQLRTVPPELDFITQVQLGVGYGHMRTGSYGSNTRRTYGVLGPQTNLAARMMTKAGQGQILVTQDAMEVVAKRYRFEALGRLSLKGSSQPVPVYEVVEEATVMRPLASQFVTPLVGRRGELVTMAQRLALARQGQGRLVRLKGPAGIGKSHLASAFCEEAINQQCQIATGVCYSTSQSAPYYPWRQLFGNLCGLTDPALVAQSNEEKIAFIARWLQALNPDWLLRLPLLGDLLGLPIPDNATTAAFEPRLRREALFALLVDILRLMSAERPLVLVLDDAHWMDEASLALTRTLATVLDDMHVVVTLVHRASEQETAMPLPDLDQLSHCHAIDLAELNGPAVTELVNHQLQGPVSPLVLSLVQAKAHGNPFFVEELLGAMLEARQLVQDQNGAWQLAQPLIEQLRAVNALVLYEGEDVLSDTAALSGVALGIPQSVQGIILSRVDYLPEAHKVTLKAAGVIGRRFEIDLLMLAHPAHVKREPLARQMEDLEARDFIRLLEQLVTPDSLPVGDFAPAGRQAGDIPVGVYMFRHQSTQEVVYETLLFAQRRQLHVAVAEALEYLRPDAREQIAYHAYLGQDWPRAMKYQLLAGKQAQQLFANSQAIDHLRKALESAGHLAEDDTRVQRQASHLGLGELLTSTGQYAEAAEHLQQALDLAGQVGDDDAQARACRWFARLSELRGDYGAALAWIQRGLALLEGQQTVEAVELLLIAGLIYVRQGDYDNAMEQARIGVQAAKQLGDGSVLARAYSLQGITLRVRGESTAAFAPIQAALDLYSEAGNIYGRGITYNELANLAYSIGEWTQAYQYHGQARQIFSQIGDLYHRLFADNNLGVIALNQGRLDEALHYLHEALETLEQVGGSAYIVGFIHMNLGHAQLLRQEPQQARQHLQIAQDTFAQAKARSSLPELYRLWAQLELNSGQLEVAKRYGGDSLSLARELKMRGEEGVALRVLGQIAASEGRPSAEAEQRLQESLACLEQAGERHEWARTQLALAQLYAHQARLEPARAALAQCLPVFRRLEARLDLAAAEAVEASLPPDR